MTEARGVYRLQIAVGAFGAAATAMALWAALSALSFRAPSPDALLNACRTADATAHAAVNLPLLATQLCMVVVVMAVVPLVAGAGALLAARRMLPRAQ